MCVCVCNIIYTWKINTPNTPLQFIRNSIYVNIKI